MARKGIIWEDGVLIYSDADLTPEDFCRFVQLEPFPEDWADAGLDDGDLRRLEIAIMCFPLQGPVIPGTGGLRKLRFAGRNSNKGKRGGVRVCYVVFQEFSLVLLMAAYAKNEKIDLSASERAAMKKQIDRIRQLLKAERQD